MRPARRFPHFDPVFIPPLGWGLGLSTRSDVYSRTFLEIIHQHPWICIYKHVCSHSSFPNSLHGQIASELRRVSFAFSDAKPRSLQFSSQKITVIWAHSKNPDPSMFIEIITPQQPVYVLLISLNRSLLLSDYYRLVHQSIGNRIEGS